MPLLDRHLTSEVNDLMRTFRLVILVGARQTGKTTLVGGRLGTASATQLSFDDSSMLHRAEEDPVGFVEGCRLLPWWTSSSGPAGISCLR